MLQYFNLEIRIVWTKYCNLSRRGYVEFHVSQIIKTVLAIVFSCVCIDNFWSNVNHEIVYFRVNPYHCTTNLQQRINLISVIPSFERNELCLINIQLKHIVIIHTLISDTYCSISDNLTVKQFCSFNSFNYNIELCVGIWMVQ